MVKILIWQVSPDVSFKDNALKILEQQHNGIEIVGEALNKDIHKVDGGGHYDILLVVGAKNKSIGMSKVTQDARKLNLPEEKLLGDWIVSIPGFTLKKYRELQRSCLSIFSVNCFCGFISNQLGLPFRSPIVNLFFSNQDFKKFLCNPHSYLEKTLTYYGQKFNAMKTFQFPVATCGDIFLNLMHYKTFEEANNAWERRKTRINWNNIFVVMWSTSPEELKQFEELPYDKKACFVPFKSDVPSAWYINPEIDKKNAPRFVDVFNRFSEGKVWYYDPFDMLLYGKKTPLIDM